MEQEEYTVDGHKVTHSVHLGDREIFLAVQQDAPLPFYVGYMEVSYELGLARFSGIEGTTEYTEAWEMFIQRLQKQIEQVRAQRQEHHAPQLLTAADCIRDSRAGDYEGKVLVMRPGVLRPEYWNAAHQLYFAVDGNGARAGSHGTKVFCINIYTGEHKEQWPAYLKKLLCAGVDTALFEPGAGQPEPVRLCRAAEALPRGGIIEIEGREHSITEVNFKSRTVILKDMEPAPGQPRYTTMDVSSAYDAFQEDGQRMAELPQAAQVQKDTPPVPKLDYRYPTESASPVGPKARFALNAAAIGTLRRIEDEGRMATAEEQGILARYVGWGGLADAFDGEKTEWAQEYAQLKSLLDESEYMAARASTLTAFYTPPTVIRAMYGALERWGVTGGNILEPSMGVGAFFGCRPEQFDTNPTGLYGVELDHISARIAGQLYQSAHIYACGYEKTALPDSFFDCAVGNVPFGSFGVHDTRYDREHWLIHDYFFGKTIDKVRVGGIIAFITSSGTLDKASGNVRRYIAQRCELIGAVRLPSDTFRQSAGTEVTSDILFLQKRERMADRDEPWLHVGKTGDGVPINQYFAEHPEMVLGDMVMEDCRRRGET